MAKLIIWSNTGALLNVETHLREQQSSNRLPAIIFEYHNHNGYYGCLELSWDEVDDLIQQLTAIKAEQKPAGKIKVLLDVLEATENRLGRLPLSSLPLIGKPGPDRDERERLNEDRLNLLSEIVKRLVQE